MADSNHARERRPWLRLAFRAIALLAMLALASGWSATPAAADGDPASDVLATQQLFLPQDTAATDTQQTQLVALLKKAAGDRYPIRTALIASPSDLGSITELWGQPQSYAQFLGQELSLIYRGALLVVMPDGFGFYHFSQPAAAEQSTLAGVRRSVANTGLAAAALTAIQRLAAASGHPLALPSAPTTSSQGGGDAAPWIVFILGGIVIVLAWTASLRARPLGQH